MTIWVTAPEAARYMRVHHRDIYKLAERGALTRHYDPKHHPRFDGAEVEALALALGFYSEPTPIVDVLRAQRLERRRGSSADGT